MPDYSFLNDYINKVVNTGDDVDPNTDIDDNDFYNVGNQDDQDQEEPGVHYGQDSYGYDNQQPQQQDDDSAQSDEEDEQNNGVMDYLLGDDDSAYTYGDEETEDMATDDSPEDESDEEGAAPPTDNHGDEGKSGGNTLGNKISNNEGQGKYTAFNSKGGGAGAVGKYQFRWNIWQDSIKKITGVKTKEQFLHSPAAQEKYYAWYEKHYLRPAAEKLKPYNRLGLSDDQLDMLVHFRGEGGAKKYLMGQQSDKPESYNVPTSQYLSSRQTGGRVSTAFTPRQQYVGLNDNSVDEMIFPMEGKNTFRGLDNGKPVFLKDEKGKSKVLRGKNHTAKMTGKVYEKRLK